MSIPEPKYTVGEAVIFRYPENPKLNHVSRVVSFDGFNKGDVFSNGQKFNRDTVVYMLSTMPNKPVPELYLHPIPKEQQNGIDAYEFIKDLTGVSA